MTNLSSFTETISMLVQENLEKINNSQNYLVKFIIIDIRTSKFICSYSYIINFFMYIKGDIDIYLPYTLESIEFS
jgi:hypothetical protein